MKAKTDPPGRARVRRGKEEELSLWFTTTVRRPKEGGRHAVARRMQPLGCPPLHADDVDAAGVRLAEARRVLGFRADLGTRRAPEDPQQR